MMVLKWMKRLKLMRISKYALIITLLLSLVFAGFTVYGARTGNFNIYLHASDVQLAIWMKEDRSDLGTHLSVPVLDEMDNTTFEYLFQPDSLERIVPGLGPKNDAWGATFLCFSFGLINYSERLVNYDMTLTVISAREGLGGGSISHALRVLVIKEEHFEEGSEYEALTTDEEREDYFRSANIYALAEESEEKQAILKEQLQDYTDYDTTDFISDIQLFEENEYDFGILCEMKYTLVMWLEGCDADCVNDLYGGRIKMRLDIRGY